ncbi:MAG: type IV secretory system conjugative DNA transfer family protein [Candidatus Korobacteraceae bacterium]
MFLFVDQLIAKFLNRFFGRRRGARPERGGAVIGYRVQDGEATARKVRLSDTRRTTHLLWVGKTGAGKSFGLRNLCVQDIEANRGFVFFDLHGEETQFLLRAINARERRLREHLHHKIVLISPADQEMSIGFDPLEAETPDFGRIADLERVLRWRWHLDHFGPRTAELLRNSLFALSANDLTLIELAPFLTHNGFRSACLKKVSNADVRQYFELRYDQASEGMRAAMREPVLNKVSEFTGNPTFRHILGQQQSSFSVRQAMDEGYWIILDLNKGRLGEQALTLGSLFFSILKNALFSRTTRSLFSWYLDEMQNLAAYDSGIETVLGESRKFGVSIVGSTQRLDSVPAEMRNAFLAVGTQVYFQLSPNDAAQVAQGLDGGRSMAERLKNLPQRHCIVKSGADRWTEVRIPTVHTPQVDLTDFMTRVRYGRGRVRAHIERDIEKRQAALLRKPAEVLNDWE